MAYTVTQYKTVFGNKKVVGLEVTADAATQTIDCGMNLIEWISLSPSSMASNNIKIAINSNTSGVQSFGVVGISGAASGDHFFMSVYGH